MGDRGWHTIARTRTGVDGRFHLRYDPDRTGSERVRVRFGGDATDRPSHRRAATIAGVDLARVGRKPKHASASLARPSRASRAAKTSLNLCR